jgi:hypothetical protein
LRIGKSLLTNLESKTAGGIKPQSNLQNKANLTGVGLNFETANPRNISGDLAGPLIFGVPVLPLPVTSAITWPDSVCPNQARVTYSVTPTSGSTYLWTGPSDATFTTGTGSPGSFTIISVTFGSASGNVTVTETDAAGCVGTTQTKAVTVNSRGAVASCA